MTDSSVQVRIISLPLTAVAKDVIIPDETRLPTGCIIKTVLADFTTLGGQGGISAVPGLSGSYAVTDFIDTFSISSTDEDDVTTTDSMTYHDDASGHIVRLYDPVTDALIRTATVTAVAGGVRVTALEAGLDHFMQVTLFFGVECKAYSVGGAINNGQTRVVTHGLTGAPDFGISYGCHAFQGSNGSLVCSMGIFSDDGGIVQHCHTQRSNNAAANGSPRGRIHTNRTMSHLAGTGNVLWEVELTVNDASDTIFTMRVGNSASMGLVGLLVFMGDAVAELAVIDTHTSPTTDWNYTGISIRPQFAYVLPTFAEVVDATMSNNDAGAFGVIEWDDTIVGGEGVETGFAFTVQNQLAISSTSSRINNRIYASGPAQAAYFEAADPLFQQGGFVLISDNIATANTPPKKWLALFIEQVGAVTPAATLSNPTVVSAGASQATGEVDTDTPNGIIYGVVTQSIVTPSHAQIVAGQDDGGAPADSAAQFQAQLGPPNELDFTGLVDGTTYFMHFTQESSGGTASANQVTSLSFQTSATNQNPTIVGPIPDQNVLIGQQYTFDVSPFFDDPDGDPLTFTGINIPEGLSMDTAGLITGVPTDGGGGTQPIIQSITFDFTGLLNTPPGNAPANTADESDNWCICHHANGHQYVSFGDGQGFKNLAGFQNTRGSFGFSRIEGSENNYSAFDVFKSGEQMPTSEQGKCYGMTCLNGNMYAAVDYYLVGGSGSREDRYHGLSLTSSDDEGFTWTEDIRWDSGDWGGNQLNGFYSMAFVQYGQNNTGQRSPLADSNYVYAIIMEHDNDDYEVQIPGGISMIRVLASNIESGNKNHWEYVSAIDGNNNPSWSTDLTNRIDIFSDPAGGNDSSSISYNAPLGRYILTVFHNTRVTGPGNNDCFIGFYDAPEPWGPWHRILKTNVQTLGLATGNAVIFWDHSNKWLSNDGLDGILVGTLLGQDEWGSIPYKLTVG